MTISSLAEWMPVYGKCYSPRAYKVQKVTVHHMAGNLSIETCRNVFNAAGRQASSNYGIGSDGRIACYVAEEDAAWTSNSYWNDNQAITIEVADQDTVNWVPSDAAYQSTVKLCADVCKRYGITPSYTGDSSGTFTEHRMFYATGCPGDWWHLHMQQFIQDIKGEMEDDMTTPADVWGYNWEDTAPQGNMYNCNVAIYKMVESMERRLDSMNAKIDKVSAASIDYDKLAAKVAEKIDKTAFAKAVNDDAAKRMQS